MRLARVLEHVDVAVGQDSADAAHVRHLTVEVNRQNAARSLRERGLERSHVQVVVRRGDVHGHRTAARLSHCFEGGDERVRRDDHFVSRFEVHRDQGEPQRVEAARDADAVGRAAEARERRLELRDLGAVGERIRVDQPADVLENPLLERVVDQREIEERNLGEGGFGDIEHLPATVVGRLFVCHSPLRGPHLAIRIARTRPPPRPLNGLSGSGLEPAAEPSYACTRDRADAARTIRKDDPLQGAGAWVIDRLPRSETSGPRHGHPRGWLVLRALLAADALGLIAAFALTSLLFGADGSQVRVTQFQQYLLFLLTLPGWVFLAKLHELYDHDEERTEHTTVDDFVGVLHAVTLGGVDAVRRLAHHRARRSRPDEGDRLLGDWRSCSSSAAAPPLERSAAAAARTSRTRSIVGAGDVGQLVARKFLQHPEYGIKLVGFVDERARRELRTDIATSASSAGSSDLPKLVAQLDVDRVIVAFSSESNEDTRRARSRG